MRIKQIQIFKVKKYQKCIVPKFVIDNVRLLLEQIKIIILVKHQKVLKYYENDCMFILTILLHLKDEAVLKIFD